MFVLGEAVDAKAAVDWGLANAAVPRAELRSTLATLLGYLEPKAKAAA